MEAARKSAKAKAAGPKSPMPPAESSDEMWRRRPEERSRGIRGLAVQAIAPAARLLGRLPLVAAVLVLFSNRESTYVDSMMHSRTAQQKCPLRSGNEGGTHGCTLRGTAILSGNERLLLVLLVHEDAAGFFVLLGDVVT